MTPPRSNLLLKSGETSPGTLRQVKSFTGSGARWAVAMVRTGKPRNLSASSTYVSARVSKEPKAVGSERALRRSSMAVLEKSTVGSVSRKSDPAEPASWQETAKRVMDVVGSLALLILLAPVLVLVALAVLFSDGPPIVFRRRCIGPNGEFDAFKFRTMRRDADRVLEHDQALRHAFHQNFKLKSDPRVTRLGAVLRKFSLDDCRNSSTC